MHREWVQRHGLARGGTARHGPSSAPRDVTSRHARKGASRASILSQGRRAVLGSIARELRVRSRHGLYSLSQDLYYSCQDRSSLETWGGGAGCAAGGEGAHPNVCLPRFAKCKKKKHWLRC